MIKLNYHHILVDENYLELSLEMVMFVLTFHKIYILLIGILYNSHCVVIKEKTICTTVYYDNIGKIRNIDKLKKYTLNVRQLRNINLHEKTYLYQLYPFAMINIFNTYL